MAFLPGQMFTLCLDKDVLAWRGDAIALVGKDGRFLANKVQMLQPTTWRLRFAVDWFQSQVDL